MNKRVVVTGIGVVSPIGIGLENFWSAIRRGECGIGPITLFDASRVDCRIAAEVGDFNPAQHFDHKTIQRTARFTQLALCAAKEAWNQAKLSTETTSPHRIAVFLGNGIGGMEVDTASHLKMFEKGPGRLPAMTIPRMIANEAVGNIAIEFGIKGPAHTIVTACASGTDAIGHALNQLRLGKADVVLTGGTEATVTEFSIGSFCALKALATSYNDNPKQASRPFDANREGFVMGEGSAIFVLETLEHARQRGADILGEVCGYGSTTDAYHLTAPDPHGEGAAAAIKLAMEDAGITPDDVDYINAHGTSTPTNDPVETMAIKSALGDRAYKIKVSSIKGMIGHCLGAAGAIEAATCIKAIADQFYPATINLETPDPQCDLDYVPKQGVPGKIRYALSTSLGFGGHNGVLVFGSVDK